MNARVWTALERGGTSCQAPPWVRFSKRGSAIEGTESTEEERRTGLLPLFSVPLCSPWPVASIDVRNMSPLHSRRRCAVGTRKAQHCADDRGSWSPEREIFFAAARIGARKCCA